MRPQIEEQAYVFTHRHGTPCGCGRRPRSQHLRLESIAAATSGRESPLCRPGLTFPVVITAAVRRAPVGLLLADLADTNYVRQRDEEGQTR